MKERIDYCWGWINKDGTIQEKTYLASSIAIDEMRKRLSLPDNPGVLDKIYMLGFKLIQLKKTIKIMRILE